MPDIYKTISGDTWDIIAYKVFGDEYYTDKLIKCNLNHSHTVIFPSDIEIAVPKKETKIPSELPPWKRGIL